MRLVELESCLTLAVYHSSAYMSQDESKRKLTREGRTRCLTETPFLFVPDVSDCKEVLLQPRFTGEGDLRGQGHEHGLVRRTSFQYNTRCDSDTGKNLLMSCCQAARPLPLGFDAENNSTAEVVPASSLTKTPLLLAPNVSDCVEVLLQPRFSSEEDACCQGHGHVPSAWRRILQRWFHPRWWPSECSNPVWIGWAHDSFFDVPRPNGWVSVSTARLPHRCSRSLGRYYHFCALVPNCRCAWFHSVLSIPRHGDFDVQLFPFSALGASTGDGSNDYISETAVSVVSREFERYVHSSHLFLQAEVSTVYSRTYATSDVCGVVLLTSVDLAVVVPGDTVCVAGYKFVGDLIYGSGDKASGVRPLLGAFLLATREFLRRRDVCERNVGLSNKSILIFDFFRKYVILLG